MQNPLEALIWWQQGFQRVIALMGCHAFKQIHLDLLREHRIERVCLALCGTAAEPDAMRTIAVMMEAANMVLFPDGQDASHFVLTTERPQADFAELFAQEIRVSRPSPVSIWSCWKPIGVTCTAIGNRVITRHSIYRHSVCA